LWLGFGPVPGFEKWERRKEDGVRGSENCGISADPKSQSSNRDCTERWLSDETSCGVLDVSEKLIHVGVCWQPLESFSAV
jgi:hypothetical protein